jgi:tetratricopeptide (TPR) repeat protein
MKLFGFVFIVTVASLTAILYFSDMVFADEIKDITKQLAERHKQQGEIYEKDARDLVHTGNLEEAAQKFELAAEQYSDAAAYYRALHDYWNSAEFNGRASLNHEEAATIHATLKNLSKSIFHYLLSDKSKAHSLQDKGIILFGDAYLLPPKFQSYLVDDPHEIDCKEGLELVFKIDGSPACVLSSTKIKLKDRGWID